MQLFKPIGQSIRELSFFRSTFFLSYTTSKSTSICTEFETLFLKFKKLYLNPYSYVCKIVHIKSKRWTFELASIFPYLNFPARLWIWTSIFDKNRTNWGLKTSLKFNFSQLCRKIVRLYAKSNIWGYIQQSRFNALLNINDISCNMFGTILIFQ